MSSFRIFMKKLWQFCYVKLLLTVDIVFLSKRLLIVQSQIKECENKVWHVFKINNKDSKTL